LMVLIHNLQQVHRYQILLNPMVHYNIHQVPLMLNQEVITIKHYTQFLYILKIFLRNLTTVRAIDSGKVMSINDFRKLNKIIVIKTKGEKLVGYANLIRTFIREGGYVKKGQIIGTAKDLLLMDIVFRGKRINPCGIKFSSRSF